MIFAELVIPVLGLSTLLYLLVLRFPLIIERPISNKDKLNVLFVTAHPDDECMFFSPTLHALSKRPNVGVTLLCLSSGNHDGLGEIP